MADACSDFVVAVQQRLKAMREGAVIPCPLGKLKWAEHSSPPLIRWARGDIDHEENLTTGGDQTAIFTRKQTLICQIWHTSEELADLLLDDLIRSVRLAAGGSANMTVGRFSWVTEEKPGVMNLGAMLEGFFVVNMLLPKSNKATVRVTIASQSHTETLTP